MLKLYQAKFDYMYHKRTHLNKRTYFKRTWVEKFQESDIQIFTFRNTFVKS